MKKILSFCVFVLVLFGYCINVHALNQIRNIYIESDGNNPFEAKIKAHKYGMRQALKLVGNRMGLDRFGQVAVPYNFLTQVFTQIELTQEDSKETFYKAYVSYEYDSEALNKLILAYGPQEIKDKFYEYAVFPILKRKNNLYTTRPNQILLSEWKQYANELKEYKLFYPTNISSLQPIITSKGLNKLTYRDIVDASEEKLFKKAVFVVMEEFAATTSGQSYVKIDYHVYAPGSHVEDKSNIVYLEDGNHNKSLADVIDTLTSKIIDEYGNFQAHMNALKLQVVEQVEAKKIEMYAQIYDKEELNSIKNKLKSSGIKADIKPLDLSEHIYQVILYADALDEKLTEALYNNELSYKQHKDKGLMLFEIKKGV